MQVLKYLYLTTYNIVEVTFIIYKTLKCRLEKLRTNLL